MKSCTACGQDAATAPSQCPGNGGREHIWKEVPESTDVSGKHVHKTPPPRMNVD